MTRAQIEARETLARLVQLLEAIAPREMVVAWLLAEVKAVNSRPGPQRTPDQPDERRRS